MTPYQVLSNVRNQLYETTAAFWTDAEIYNYIWHAEQEIVLQIHCATIQTAATTVTAQSMYTAPESMYYIDRMTWSNVKLKKIDFTDLDTLQRPGYGGTYTSGSPTYYYLSGIQFGLWPIPASSATLNIYGSKIPILATGASSEFVCEPLFHPCIQDYALYRCWLKDQDDGRSKFFESQWKQGLSRAYTYWAARENADAHYTVRDEDNYPSEELGLV
jgi:hypothetical protein